MCCDSFLSPFSSSNRILTFSAVFIRICHYLDISQRLCGLLESQSALTRCLRKEGMRKSSWRNKRPSESLTMLDGYTSYCHLKIQLWIIFYHYGVWQDEENNLLGMC